MFTSNIIREVANIKRIQYELKNGCQNPTRTEFVSIITNVVKEIKAINVVLYYIDDLDNARWISFSRDDINRLGLEECVSLIEYGILKWDSDMYHGSDNIYSHIVHSTLCLNTFCVIVPRTPR